jgi:hypothetical protein
MPLSSEEDEFVEVASASLPRIAEIIAAFPAEDRAGALEVAERRYLQAARDYGCTQAETERWVAAIMRCGQDWKRNRRGKGTDAHSGDPSNLQRTRDATMPDKLFDYLVSSR